jgi:hypothetical protein
MKEHLYKNATITFIIINVWTLILFFNYLLETPGFLYGFGTLCLYLYSMFFGILIAVITLLLRVFVFKKHKAQKLKSNFFYLFAGVFNLNIFLTWLVTVLLKILEVDQGEILEIVVCNCLLSLTILIDIFLLNSIQKTESKVETKV